MQLARGAGRGTEMLCGEIALTREGSQTEAIPGSVGLLVNMRDHAAQRSIEQGQSRSGTDLVLGQLGLFRNPRIIVQVFIAGHSTRPKRLKTVFVGHWSFLRNPFQNRLSNAYRRWRLPGRTVVASVSANCVENASFLCNHRKCAMKRDHRLRGSVRAVLSIAICNSYSRRPTSMAAVRTQSGEVVRQGHAPLAETCAKLRPKKRLHLQLQRDDLGRN